MIRHRRPLGSGGANFWPRDPSPHGLYARATTTVDKERSRTDCPLVALMSQRVRKHGWNRGSAPHVVVETPDLVANFLTVDFFTAAAGVGVNKLWHSIAEAVVIAESPIAIPRGYRVPRFGCAKDIFVPILWTRGRAQKALLLSVAACEASGVPPLTPREAAAIEGGPRAPWSGALGKVWSYEQLMQVMAVYGGASGYAQRRLTFERRRENKVLKAAFAGVSAAASAGSLEEDLAAQVRLALPLLGLSAGDLDADERRMIRTRAGRKLRPTLVSLVQGRYIRSLGSNAASELNSLYGEICEQSVDGILPLADETDDDEANDDAYLDRGSVLAQAIDMLAKRKAYKLPADGIPWLARSGASTRQQVDAAVRAARR